MNVRHILPAMAGVLCCLQAGGCMDPVEARAGGDRTVAAGETVTLDGSASLPRNKNRIAYLWQVVDGPAVTIADQTAGATTFTAPTEASESKITVRLTVTYVDFSGSQYAGNRDSDEVLIRVRADRTLSADEVTSGDGAAEADTNGVADQNTNGATDTDTSGAAK